MSCINREEAIRLIMEYQGGAMDKPTAKKVLENMDGIEICEDTISRQVAIDWLTNEWDGMVTSVFDGIKNLSSAQPEIIRCKDCKHFHYDMPYVIQGIPVLGHEVCNAWGDGCKTDENGWCFLAERANDGR